MDANAPHRRPDGMNPAMIAAVTGMRNDPDDPRRRRLMLCDVNVERVDALYLVGFLLSQQQQQMILVLWLDPGQFSAAALDVFCPFLRTTTQLQALVVVRWAGASGEFRRVLEALHNNASVKDLKVIILDAHATGEDLTEYVAMTATLLRQRSDFHALDFYVSPNDSGATTTIRWVRAMQTGLIHGQPLLKKLNLKLNMDYRNLRDEGMGLIVQALEQGNFESLEELDLEGNKISPRGLAALSRLLVPSALPRLQKLILKCNLHMLDDRDTNQHFARDLLKSQVKELDISECSAQAHGYGNILEALEDSSDATLNRLIMTTMWMGPGLPRNRLREAVRGQLAQSLPKIKGLHCLVCDEAVLVPDGQESMLMRAFYKNLSLVALATRARYLNRSMQEEDPCIPPFLAAILERNERLANVDSILRVSRAVTATTNAAAAPAAAPNVVIPPISIWSKVLTKVGQGPHGSTPVFKVLQDRLATWNE